MTRKNGSRYHPCAVFIYFMLLELTIKRIISKTKEGDGVCVVWTGAARHGTPTLMTPLRRHALAVNSDAPTQLSVRLLLVEIFTRKLPSAEMKTQSFHVVGKCGCRECVSPHCSEYVEKSQLIKRGIKNMDAGAKLLRSKRTAKVSRARGVLNKDQIELIRSELSVSCYELARKLNVTASVVHKCRGMRSYVDRTPSPFAGLI